MVSPKYSYLRRMQKYKQYTEREKERMAIFQFMISFLGISDTGGTWASWGFGEESWEGGGGGELVRVSKPIKACFVCVGLACGSAG